MTLVAYESDERVRAFVVHLQVGEGLSDMPLFLEPDRAVSVPLEATYQAAFEAVPEVWREVLNR